MRRVPGEWLVLILMGGALLLVPACAAGGRYGPSEEAPVVLQPVRSGGPGSGPLAAELDEILDDPSFTQAFWGVKVQRLDTGDILYERNADARARNQTKQKQRTEKAKI